MDEKHFKIGLFKSGGQMEGYGRKVRRDDNQTLEGIFVNDNLIQDSISS